MFSTSEYMTLSDIAQHRQTDNNIHIILFGADGEFVSG